MHDRTSRKLVDDGSSEITQKSQLIESIYRIALEPQTYDGFMSRWDEFIQDRLSELDTLQGEGGVLDSSEVAAHFEIAQRLLEQARVDGEPQSLVGQNQSNSSQAGPDPQFLVGSSGAIVWSNAAAARMLGLRRNSRIEELDLPSRYHSVLVDKVANLSAKSQHNEPPWIFQMPVVADSDGLTVGQMVHLQAQRLSGQLDSSLLHIQPLAAVWPPAMQNLLKTTYGLSQSESEICELLSHAHRPKDVAAHRSSAIATVRTQIKSILVKTGCSSQTELVRLLLLLMRIAETHGPSRPAAPISQGKMAPVALKSGSVMPIELHGPTNGKPVIFLHGMLDGASLTSQLRESLTRN